MNRNQRLLLLGQQKFAQNKDCESKRKLISPEKENSTPSLKRQEQDAGCGGEQEELARENDDFVTPPQQLQITSKSGWPVLKENGIQNEGSGKSELKEELSKKKVQRKLFSSSHASNTREWRSKHIKSGISFNCLTNVGLSPLDVHHVEQFQSSVTDFTCEEQSIASRKNLESSEIVSEPVSESGCVLQHESRAFANILESYDSSDEETAVTDTCSSNFTHLLRSHSPDIIGSPKLMVGSTAAVSPLRNLVRSSSCASIVDHHDASPLWIESPERANSPDTVNQSTNIFQDSSRSLKAKFPQLKKSDESNVDSLIQDPVSLIVDLQDAGIDVSEEVILLPITPLKAIEDPIPDQNIYSDEHVGDCDNPDDPNYVFDDAAPQNLSGLDSDAGSSGGSPKSRRKNQDNWKKSKGKVGNSKGLKHVSTKGKEKPARDVIPEGCSKTCKRKCHELITMDQRKVINNKYWSIGNSSRQWDFLSRHVRVLVVQRRTTNVDDSDDHYRKHSYGYFFTIGNEQLQVCQQFFLKTLNISAMRVRLAMKKMLSKDGVISPDKRGKTGKRRKLHESLIASVVTHIESFPTYESHYCRKSSKKKYLDEKLNVAKMHRNYIASRGEGTPFTATLRQYEDIFRLKFKHKLGFYKPKKDQCGQCLLWKSRSPEEKLDENNKASYEKHINNKTMARKIKDENIELGKINSKVCAASFDLQKVFFCPYGDNGEYIFRRKLRSYNLSIFQSVTGDAYCHVWDETTAKKGAIEISSCVWSFIELKVAEGFKTFYFVSDNCWNQNKNSILFAMYNMASIKFEIEINHSYLEKGHTQMECDSIHSLIERRCKNVTICTPQQWYMIIRTAKRPNKKKNVQFKPYKVIVMTKENIFDFKKVLSEQNLDKIPKSKVRQITICNNTAKYRKEFNEELQEVSLLKKRAGRPINFKTYRLEQKYSETLKLKPKQLQDLLWLCNQGHIPKPDSDFYYSLAVAEAQLETDAASDSNDDEEDEVDDASGYDSQ